MSFQSVCTTEGGVVAGWDTLESSGTSLADFSGNGFPATLGSRATLGGTPIITGTARNLTALGGSGNIATRAVAGGSLLQIANDITVVGFVRGGPSTPPAVNGLLGERATNWQSRITSTRVHAVYLTLGGVLQSSFPCIGITPLNNGDRHLAWFRRRASDGYFDLGVNDGIESAQYLLPGTGFSAVTDPFNWGSVSGNAFEGGFGPLAIFDHFVELGVFRAMVREDTTLDYGRVNGVGSVLFDYTGDRNLFVAAGAQNAICQGCGGLMRENEAKVLSTGSKSWHVGCRTSKNRGTVTVINSSSVQADYAKRCDAAIRHLIGIWAHRPSASKPAYWDGVGWRTSTNPSGTNMHNECGMGVPAAALARYLKTGPGDYLMKVAYQNVELGLSRDNSTYWWGAADFSLPHVGKTLVFLQGRMDKGQWGEWRDQFLAGHDDYCVTGGPITDTGSSRGPGGGYTVPYIINGNRELGMLESFWLAWYLDPTPTRRTQYEAQRAHIENPPAIAAQPGGITSGLTFGLVTQIAPAQADGSDGKGWFREAHASGGPAFPAIGNTIKGFWNNGGPVEGDGFKETVNVDGYDKGYTVTQMERCTTLFLLSGEQLYARWANMLMNKTQDVMNTTTGVYDGTYGSRHCANFTYQESTAHALTWRGQRATNAYSAAFLATLWNINASQSILNGKTPVDATGRDMAASGLGSFLLGLDTWPGH